MIKNKDIPEGFERLIKGEKLGLLANRTIAVTGDRITFSKDLGKLIKDFFGLEVLINRKLKKILFIPSNDGSVACKLTHPSNNLNQKKNGYTSFSIFSKRFSREKIKLGHYSVRFNLGRIEFDYKLKDTELNQPKTEKENSKQ